jgi:hypothetical protein
MVRCLNVFVGDAAEKAMLHEPALDFVPDPGKARIELLSALLVFHGAPRHLAWLIPIDITPSHKCLLFFMGRTAAAPQRFSALSLRWSSGQY